MDALIAALTHYPALAGQLHHSHNAWCEVLDTLPRRADHACKMLRDSLGRLIEALKSTTGVSNHARVTRLTAKLTAGSSTACRFALPFSYGAQRGTELLLQLQGGEADRVMEELLAEEQMQKAKQPDSIQHTKSKTR